jgi:hypothetical protein
MQPVADLGVQWVPAVALPPEPAVEAQQAVVVGDYPVVREPGHSRVLHTPLGDRLGGDVEAQGLAALLPLEIVVRDVGSIPDLGVDKAGRESGEATECARHGRPDMAGELLHLGGTGTGVRPRVGLAVPIHPQKALKVLVPLHPAAGVEIDDRAKAIGQVVVEHPRHGLRTHRRTGRPFAVLPDHRVVDHVPQIVGETNLPQALHVSRAPHDHRHLIGHRPSDNRDGNILLHCVDPPPGIPPRQTESQNIPVGAQGRIDRQLQRHGAADTQLPRRHGHTRPDQRRLPGDVEQFEPGVVDNARLDPRLGLAPPEDRPPGAQHKSQGPGECRLHAGRNPDFVDEPGEPRMGTPHTVSKNQRVGARGHRALALAGASPHAFAVHEQTDGPRPVVGEGYMPPVPGRKLDRRRAVPRGVLAEPQADIQDELPARRSREVQAVPLVGARNVLGIVVVLLVKQECGLAGGQLGLRSDPHLDRERSGRGQNRGRRGGGALGGVLPRDDGEGLQRAAKPASSHESGSPPQLQGRRALGVDSGSRPIEVPKGKNRRAGGLLAPIGVLPGGGGLLRRPGYPHPKACKEPTNRQESTHAFASYIWWAAPSRRLPQAFSRTLRANTRK